MDFSPELRTQGHNTESILKLDFQERLEILLEMKLGGVAGQGYKKLQGGSMFRKL